jgi:RND family efflux transporter MFP subunit
MLFKMKLFLLATVVLITACGNKKEETPAPAHAVRTVAAVSSAQPLLALSGTIRAEVETPIAFQINGRIAQRLIQAGQTVKKGQVLFELDPRDLNQVLQASAAEVAAASSALSTAKSDTQRNRKLLQEKFISQQGFDRALLQEKEAQTRFDAATSRQKQALNATEYANLMAPNDGIITELTGEAGQVVTAGQPIGTLAHAGPLEVEVFLPEGFKAPLTGQAQFGNQTATVTLREAAGSADPVSRTVRARYQLANLPQPWPLGSVAKVSLKSTMPSAQSNVTINTPNNKSNDAANNTHALPVTTTASSQSAQPQKTITTVPIAALDERGQGPQVWLIIEGKAQPLEVKLISLNAETAVIEANLPVGTKVIALGTHLLKPGMPVREIAP